jgi:hypothetical protein
MVSYRNEWVKFHLVRGLIWRDVPGFLPEIARTENLGRLLHARLLPITFYREAYQRGLMDLACWLLKNSDTASNERTNPMPGFNWDSLVTPDSSDPSMGPAEHTQVGLREVERFLRHYQLGGNCVPALHRILAVCRAERIESILLAPPMSTAQRALYTPQIEGAFKSLVRQMVQTYGCSFVDCRDWLADSEFRDNHHATVQGCVHFSHRASERVLAPLWQNRSTSPGPGEVWQELH